MSNKIEPKVVKNWLSDGKEIAFIDIRELGQHTAGHPFFSISIPFSVFEFSGNFVKNSCLFYIISLKFNRFVVKPQCLF